MVSKITTKQKYGGVYMNNFTTNCYEMKREIANLSKKLSKGVSKPTYKFLTDMLYGLAKKWKLFDF